MRYLLVVLGVLVAVVVVVVTVGYALPARHRASRSAKFASSSNALFTAITDVEHYPSWRSDVTRVDLVPNGGGPSRFREVGRNGTILYEIERRDPDRQFVTRIADPTLPFGGTWTYDITPANDGATVRITEDGEVRNPVFRFVSRFILGQTATMDRYLTDLGRRFGATPIIID